MVLTRSPVINCLHGERNGVLDLELQNRVQATFNLNKTHDFHSWKEFTEFFRVFLGDFYAPGFNGKGLFDTALSAMTID